MFNQFGRLADWIIDHRWISFLLVAALTAVTAIGHYDPRILLGEPAPQHAPAEQEVDDEEAQEEETEEEPRKERPNVQPIQVDAGNVIVVAQCENFFSPDGADAIRDAVVAIQELPQVSRVFWMDQAPMMNIFGLAEPILPRRNASEVRFDAAKKRALEHPLVVGQLLSADAKTILLMVDFDFFYVMSNEDCTDVLRDTAAAAAAKYPDAPMTFQVTGNVPIALSRKSMSRRNELKYQAIGYSIALVIAFILFRGLSAVIIVALAPAMGVFWTLGIFHFFELDDNGFNSVVVPVLLCMVGFTDGVHMMVQIRKHRAAGLSAADAARQSIREVGLACWLTSLTTAIGFGSLVFAHHEVVREFGYCCVLGVMMTFLSVITIIPLLCASPLGSRVHTGYGRNLVDKNLERISGIIDFVIDRHRLIGWIAIGLTIVLGAVTLLLRPDERTTSNLSESTEPAIALAHIDKHFGGMETAQVGINFSVPSDSGEIMTVVGKVENLLRAEPKLGYPLSIYSLLKALPGDGDPADRMSLLDLLPPQLKRAYFQPEDNYATVTFRLQDIGIAQYNDVFERVEQQLTVIEKQHPDFSIQLGGNAVWRWRNLYRIVVDLAVSLGTASVIIFFVLAMVYRSVRIGLISIIPNTFPLAATGCVMYFAELNLEIVSVCAFTVCLGIAVDDTIHFLTRFYEEDETTEDRAVAIRNAFVGVGTALIMTTIVLVIAFATAFLSDARDFRIFAMMGVLTIGCALFADLFFLPALLIRYAPKRKPNQAND